MTRSLALFLMAILAGWYAFVPARRRTLSKRARSAPNYRGKPIPLTLGLALAEAVFLTGFVLVLVLIATGRGGAGLAARLATVLGMSALPFAAGLYDDVRSGPSRGLLGHAREMARGRVTTGAVKLLAAVVSAVVVVAVIGGSGWRVALGVPVIAGATNLWNLLDVAPGRAIKYFLPAGVALTALAWNREFAFLGAAALGAATAVFPFDLRERAMLGDTGANLLGFVAGIGLYRVLSAPLGLAIALGVILVAHAVGETVTLSRVIEATPPLRWFDGVGRVHRPGRETEPAGGTAGVS
jgi:hypothetical protein